MFSDFQTICVGASLGGVGLKIWGIRDVLGRQLVSIVLSRGRLIDLQLRSYLPMYSVSTSRTIITSYVLVYDHPFGYTAGGGLSIWTRACTNHSWTVLSKCTHIRSIDLVRSILTPPFKSSPSPFRMCAVYVSHMVRVL